MAEVACELGTQDSCPAALAPALLFWSRIHGIPLVFEHDTKESGDPDADDVHTTACWSLCPPENLGAVDEL